MEEKHVRIYLSIVIILFLFYVLQTAHASTIVMLQDVGSGNYRWRDVADQLYAQSYRSSYNYTQASVQVEHFTNTTTLYGTLSAANLKPNFAYQLKLEGTAGAPDNELIGLTGRWWQEEWNGTAWANGQNLNNKGDGSSPNPNDDLYFARRDTPDPTSPTGKRYKYTGYLVFDYFITDESGNATLNFEANSSYHVLWKTSQRAHTAQDGPLKATTFEVTLPHPAYDTSYPETTVSIFGEWERLPVGSVTLPPGTYGATFLLTEESFHGSGGQFAGCWAAAMSGSAEFTIIPEPATMLLLGLGVVAFWRERRA